MLNSFKFHFHFPNDESRRTAMRNLYSLGSQMILICYPLLNFDSLSYSRILQYSYSDSAKIIIKVNFCRNEIEIKSYFLSTSFSLFLPKLHMVLLLAQSTEKPKAITQDTHLLFNFSLTFFFHTHIELEKFEVWRTKSFQRKEELWPCVGKEV